LMGVLDDRKESGDNRLNSNNSLSTHTLAA
jgi:hypothetical protein